MSLFEIPRECFRARFAVAPFLLPHRLGRHELFSLARLAELAARLPASQVEYNAGSVPIGLDPALAPGNGLSPEETIRRIEQCGSWLVLKRVERDPAYREVLEQCVAEVRVAAGVRAAGLCRPRAFVFVSSPGAVTPYHVDPEENFLLQIRGTKSMSVFDPSDRSIVSEAELERFFSGAHRNLAYRDDYQRRAHVFRLHPGIALHVPFAAPHWVQNGPEVSVSFSITFNTRASMRATHAYRVNHHLRRWGLEPAPVGRSPLRDAVKEILSRGGSAGEKFLHQPRRVQRAIANFAQTGIFRRGAPGGSI